MGELKLEYGEMILSIGLDVVEIPSLDRDIAVGGRRFLERVFTERELEICQERHDQLAARFAGKEAVAKALGTGIRRVDWRDIEILPTQHADNGVILHGSARTVAQTRQMTDIELSISCTAGLAIAIAIAQCGKRSLEGLREGGPYDRQQGANRGDGC
jgi:holo-[acyl-carrier protein] synthase